MTATAVLAANAVAHGSLGVVGAGARTAAVIGAAALLDGGNAFDAVIAAGLAETVLLPPKCGLAGDVVALVLPAGRPAPRALLSIGAAARRLPGALATRPLPRDGGLSVGVPGAPGGYAALAALGRLGLDRLARPAIELARRGIVWPELCAALAREADGLLARHQPTGCRYRPAAGPLKAGTLLRLPGLALLLGEFAERGAGLFHGPAGAVLAERVAAAGGVVGRDDLAVPTAEWAEPVRQDGIWATPAPTRGPALLAALAGERALAGGPIGEGTSVVAAADNEGNAVVMVHSNSHPQFGSGLVAEPYDLVLSNRAGRGFHPDPGHPDGPAPGRRPPTTLHAWALDTRGTGRPDVFGATPGGEQQVPWNAQVLGDLMTTGPDDLGAILTGPRWSLQDGARVPVEESASAVRPAHVLLRLTGAGLTAAADPRIGAIALGV
ncbi:gamma-glutamyltransferase [Acrocarpospora sp. B8E8]|uniref:gamma-glutamyltransferase n=1 Tax=Acrocarpospora sp. B8E8 TaxID=3153572 RepID=UPI00325F5412